LKAIEERAYERTKHANLTIVDRYYDRLLILNLWKRLKKNTYPLSVSAERVFQAIEAIKYAKSVGATAIARVGAGNDQIRFDLIDIAPEIEIITPIRDLKLSRQEEVDYLSKNGVHYSWEKSPIFD
jgi:argininosuccinate synthase